MAYNSTYILEFCILWIFNYLKNSKRLSLVLQI
jgi:hypothetical protein